MKHLKIELLLFLGLILTNNAFGQKTIWQIGVSDNSAEEFALAPADYSRFLECDFGWEDRFFAIGFSDEKKDMPYVLPGASDYWGGHITNRGYSAP